MNDGSIADLASSRLTSGGELATCSPTAAVSSISDPCISFDSIDACVDPGFGIFMKVVPGFERPMNDGSIADLASSRRTGTSRAPASCTSCMSLDSSDKGEAIGGFWTKVLPGLGRWRKSGVASPGCQVSDLSSGGTGPRRSDPLCSPS